jgi:hypothetical protein
MDRKKLHVLSDRTHSINANVGKVPQELTGLPPGHRDHETKADSGTHAGLDLDPRVARAETSNYRRDYISL